MIDSSFLLGLQLAAIGLTDHSGLESGAEEGGEGFEELLNALLGGEQASIELSSDGSVVVTLGEAVGVESDVIPFPPNVIPFPSDRVRVEPDPQEEPGPSLEPVPDSGAPVAPSGGTAAPVEGSTVRPVAGPGREAPPTPGSLPASSTPVPVETRGAADAAPVAASPAAGRVVTPAPTAGPAVAATDAVTPPPLAPETAPSAATARGVGTGPAAAGSMPLVGRVLAAVEQLRNAPPPQMMVIEMAEMDGLRIGITLRGAAVHLSFSGPGSEQAESWTPQLADALERHGFDMSEFRREEAGAGEREDGRWAPIRRHAVERPPVQRDDDLRL